MMNFLLKIFGKQKRKKNLKIRLLANSNAIRISK